jgi:hypothetical protein
MAQRLSRETMRMSQKRQERQLTKEDTMRYYAVFLAVGMLLPFAVWAQKQMYAIPTQKEVPVYQNEIRKLFESPLFTVSSESRLVVKETGKNAIKVQDLDGRTGWVEKARVKIISQNKTIKYEPAAVEGYINDPGVIWVPGKPDPLTNPVILERSFADALRENVDQETIMRQVN